MDQVTPRPGESEQQAGKRIDKIQHNERLRTAVQAFNKVTGGPDLIIQDNSSDGLDYPNLGAAEAFAERLVALTRGGKLTVHQAANQVVREMYPKTFAGKPGDGLTTADFDRVYHNILDKKNIPQLRHDTGPQR